MAIAIIESNFNAKNVNSLLQTSLTTIFIQTTARTCCVSCCYCLPGGETCCVSCCCCLPAGGIVSSSCGASKSLRRREVGCSSWNPASCYRPSAFSSCLSACGSKKKKIKWEHKKRSYFFGRYNHNLSYVFNPWLKNRKFHSVLRYCIVHIDNGKHVQNLVLGTFPSEPQRNHTIRNGPQKINMKPKLIIRTYLPLGCYSLAMDEINKNRLLPPLVGEKIPGRVLHL